MAIITSKLTFVKLHELHLLLVLIWGCLLLWAVFGLDERGSLLTVVGQQVSF